MRALIYALIGLVQIWDLSVPAIPEIIPCSCVPFSMEVSTMSTKAASTSTYSAYNKDKAGIIYLASTLFQVTALYHLRNQKPNMSRQTTAEPRIQGPGLSGSRVYSLPSSPASLCSQLENTWSKQQSKISTILVQNLGSHDSRIFFPTELP